MYSRQIQDSAFHPHRRLARLIRRAAYKILFVSSMIVSVLASASPAYARIAQSLTAFGDAVGPDTTEIASPPAPLMLIENQGQFDSSIKFQLEAGGGSAGFTEKSILIAVENPGVNPPWVVEGEPSDGISPMPAPPEQSDEEAMFSVVEIQFGGVNPEPQIGGENMLPARISYFLSDDPENWAADVPAFGKIRYTDFATGYDLEIDGSSGAWEWRLVASIESPASMKSSRSFEGYASIQAEGEDELPDLTLTVEGGEVRLEDGNIVIETDAGNITLPLIDVPQETQPDEPSVSGDTVDSPFAKEGDAETASYPAGQYRPSGKGLQGFFSWISASSYGSLVSPQYLSQPQRQDEEKGELAFSSFLGGAMDDTCDDLAYDSDGNLFVTGRAPSIWIPEEGASPNLGPRGNWDIFIAKINPQRHLESLTFIGGTRNDFSSGITVDESGNIYVTGNTTSNNDFPLSPTLPAYKGHHNNPYTYVTDMIIFKLSGGGDSILFATYLGDPYSYEYGYDIVHVPGSGGVIYVTGFTDAQNNHNGILVGFNTTLGGTASLLTWKTIGNSYSQEQAHGIAVSPLDNSLWVVGQTAPVGGSGGFNPAPAGGYDVFIQHYSAASNPALLSTTFFGGNGADCEIAGSFRECDIAVDAAGNAYVSGNTESSDLAARYPQGGGFQDYGGGGDAFALKLHAEACAAGGGECLKLDYWRHLGGGSADSANSIAVSAAGDAYIAGTTESSDFSTSPFPKALMPDSTCNGRDSFLVRLAPEGQISFFTYLGGTNSEQTGGAALFEEGGKAALAGGTSGQGTGEFPLVDPVDSSKISTWEGFVSEFTVPDWEPGTGITITSPTDFAMVLSLRPEFQWTQYPGTDHYEIVVYNVAGNVEDPESIHPTTPIRTDLVRSSFCIPNMEGEWCFKWKEPWLHADGYELKSGEVLSQGGYAFEVSAFSVDDELIAKSNPAFFQIPALGVNWGEYRNILTQCNSRGCTEKLNNPYWHAYDDLFYRWAEYYDLIPSMLKAIMIAETAKDGAEIDIPSNRNDPNSSSAFFPPHFAYGYEGGWDWHIHYDPTVYKGNTGLYYRYDQHPHPFDVPFFIWNQEFSDYHSTYYNIYKDYIEGGDHPPHPSEIKCTIIDPIFPELNIENSDCPFPYERIVPIVGDTRPVTIYRYGWLSKYAGAFSNTSLGQRALNWVPGCENLSDPNDCLADKPWMPAQYRMMASYGLGQVVYWTREYMKNGVPPEQLYDPELGSMESAKTLSDKRCNDIPSLGMRSTWDAWAAPLGDYNGDTAYVGRIKTRQPYVQPEPIIGSMTEPIHGFDIIQVALPSDQFSYPEGSSKPLYSQAKGSDNWYLRLESFLRGEISLFELFSPLWESEEEILNQFEFDFGGRNLWVESVYFENPDLPGIGTGIIRIYSDRLKAEILWQSPAINSVFPYASKSEARGGSNGNPILLSEWQIGLHSFRIVPIQYIGEGFRLVPVYDNTINSGIGFFSDGGGIFSFPDGSVDAGRRTYENLGENNFYVYQYTGEQYFLSRIVPSDNSEDVNPPITQATITPQANEDGWWNAPVVLHLAGMDDHELLKIIVFQNGGEEPILYTPLEEIDMPFSEGVWRIGYQSVDWNGNIESLQNVQIKMDQTSPKTSLWLNGSPDITEYYNGIVTIDLKSEDPVLADGSEGSGVKTIEYTLDTEDDWVAYEEPFTIEESGTHLIRYRAIDFAGNVSEESETVIHIDQDPPDTFFDVLGCPEQEGYYACPAQIHLFAEDYKLPDGSPGSGVDRIEYRQNGSEEWILYTDDILLNSSGYHVLQFRSIDKAGNINESDLLEIWVDLESPISSAVISGEPVSEGQYSTGALVEISAQDPPLSDGGAGSGLKYIEIRIDAENNWQTYTDPIVLEQSGLHTIFFRPADMAGNIEETQQIEVEIVSDVNPPALEVSADPLQLWPPNNKLISVRIFGTAFDTGSGIQSIHIEVIDEYGECQPVIQDILPDEIVDGHWERTIELMASRKGNDKDGRKYTIIVTATDNLGNAMTKEIEVIVPHDQGG
jgi:hypothetical protein